MNFKLKNKPIKIAPRYLVAAMTCSLFTMSGLASAETTDVEPVDKLKQLIDNTTVINQNRTITVVDDSQAQENAQNQNNKTAQNTSNELNESNSQSSSEPDLNNEYGSYPSVPLKINQNQVYKPKITEAPETQPSQNADPIDDSQNQTEESSSADVNANVDADISAQENSDVESGVAVASAPNADSDDDSIKSIENKNGKLYKTTNLSNYARAVNSAVWSPNMRKNTAMTIKMQTLLDWNHASPGPIDGGWGMNSKKALANFQAMRGLPSTGRMNPETWKELVKNIDMSKPVLVEYTITNSDVNTNFARTPSGSEAKSKMKGLYYQNIKEMIAERFHMDVRYLEKLNKGKKFTAGETITVVNKREPLNARINRVVAKKADKTLYAYDGNKLVATYPTTVGSSNTPSPTGTYKIVNKVKMPWYKATVNKDTENKKVFMLPPGPNNPVGVVWMGLSKPSYGIHGSPIPEGISRQASAGCVRLTNWDVLDVYANIEKGATVELK